MPSRRSGWERGRRLRPTLFFFFGRAAVVREDHYPARPDLGRVLINRRPNADLDAPSNVRCANNAGAMTCEESEIDGATRPLSAGSRRGGGGTP